MSHAGYQFFIQIGLHPHIKWSSTSAFIFPNAAMAIKGAYKLLGKRGYTDKQIHRSWIHTRRAPHAPAAVPKDVNKHFKATCTGAISAPAFKQGKNIIPGSDWFFSDKRAKQVPSTVPGWD
jgi:hypothetical protein